MPVVAGLAISVAGVAWAISAYEYAASLRDQVQLYREELAAGRLSRRAVANVEALQAAEAPDALWKARDPVCAERRRQGGDEVASMLRAGSRRPRERAARPHSHRQRQANRAKIPFPRA